MYAWHSKIVRPVTFALVAFLIGCALSLPALERAEDGELSLSPNGTVHEEVVVAASLYVRKKPARQQRQQPIVPVHSMGKREIRMQQSVGAAEGKSHGDKIFGNSKRLNEKGFPQSQPTPRHGNHL
ncbi:uncharacterized protein LOC128267269 [Anopheles cruzii]|uniref:uncharacterized protein LOC128267269 n=1 Tax=Anopheles cruzii TaxID=68878 RepID=UPI0022EC7E10|nr:uncharacterized protein LOC128267269 [Anopheles cruzii]